MGSLFFPKNKLITKGIWEHGSDRQKRRLMLYRNIMKRTLEYFYDSGQVSESQKIIDVIEFEDLAIGIREFLANTAK